MDRPPISAVIITFNEATIIERCVRALSWCDEVVVVDSGSTDGTDEICRGLGCRVVHHPFAGFGEQKQYSVDQATHPWVLSIDADEIIPEDMAREIQQTISAAKHAAYRVPRRLFFVGQRFGHGRGSLDSPIKLMQSAKARFSVDAIHETVQVEGTVGTLTTEMEHHSYISLTQYLHKFNRYTTLSARDLRRQGIRRSIIATFVTMPLYFIKHYVIAGHWMNGVHGLVWSVLSTWYPFVKVAKSRMDQEA